MKKLLLIAFIAALFSSCSQSSYSPIDTYINTTIKQYQDSVKETKANIEFINSHK